MLWIFGILLILLLIGGIISSRARLAKTTEQKADSLLAIIDSSPVDIDSFQVQPATSTVPLSSDISISEINSHGNIEQSDTNSLQRIAKNLVFNLVQAINDKDFEHAFSLTINPNWSTAESLSNIYSGFGNLENFIVYGLNVFDITSNGC